MTNKTLDLTKPVEKMFLAGRTLSVPARIICTDREGENPVIFLYKEAGREVISSCKLDGTAGYGSDSTVLVNVVNKTSTFQNIYPFILGGTEWPDLESASAKDTLGYIRRDYEDGVLVNTVVVPIPVTQKEN